MIAPRAHFHALMSLALLLLTALAATAERTEVAVDLAVPDHTATVQRIPGSAPFRVRLLNRIPSAAYRVAIQWHGGSRDGQRPIFDLPPVAPTAGAFPPACGDLGREIERIRSATDEQDLSATLKRVDAMRSRCPDGGAALDDRIEQTRTLIDEELEALGAEEVDVTVERLGAQNQFVRTRDVFLRITRTAVAAVESPGAAPRPVWRGGTETEWLAGEIVRGLAEFALFAAHRPIPTDIAVSAQTAPPREGTAAVILIAVGPDASSPIRSELAIRDYVWSPSRYVEIARTLLGPAGAVSPAVASSSTSSSTMAKLLDLRSVTMEEENARLSALLASHPLDAETHERAAVLLGALALREAAGPYSDIRLTLTQMTTHLALAHAVRGGRPASLDGRLAELILLALSGRTRDALDGLPVFERDGSAERAVAAWARALRLRCTRDWRILAKPEGASLAERLEYVRGVTQSLSGRHALEFVSARPAEIVPDWGRIVLQRAFSVEEGNRYAEANVLLELGEAAAVWSMAHGRPLTIDELPAVLDVPAGRCLRHADGNQPRVIDWGSWASFYRRHLLKAQESLDRHLLENVRRVEAAQAADEELDHRFGGMRLHAFVLHSRADLWTARPDLSAAPVAKAAPKPAQMREEFCRAFTSAVAQHPEWVTAANWNRGLKCPSNADSPLPTVAEWFSTGVPAGTAYDALERLGLGGPLWDRLTELRRLSPYDKGVIGSDLNKRFGLTHPVGEFERAYGVLLDYDVGLMRSRAGLSESNEAEYRRLYDKICEIDPESCFVLAYYLERRELDDEAAAVYRRGIANARDLVAMSNNAAWLVRYLSDRGQGAEAMALAQKAAATFSARGLETLGDLFFRLKRYDEAEAHFKTIKDRYGTDDALSRFYMRYAARVPDGHFGARSGEALKKLFPSGLEWVRLDELAGPPADGLVIRDWSRRIEGLGLKTGDVIVALDGYRVHNASQYLGIRGLTDDPTVTLVAWHEGGYVEVSGSFRDRSVRSVLESYRRNP